MVGERLLRLIGHVIYSVPIRTTAIKLSTLYFAIGYFFPVGLRLFIRHHDRIQSKYEILNAHENSLLIHQMCLISPNFMKDTWSSVVPAWFHLKEAKSIRLNDICT